MHQLIYTSEAGPDITATDVFQIVAKSARNNPAADITGFLIYQRGRFLQLVEGPLMSLETLLASLSADPRHHSLKIVSREPVSGRSFPRWRMHRVGDTGDALAEIERALNVERPGATVPDVVREFLAETVDA